MNKRYVIIVPLVVGFFAAVIWWPKAKSSPAPTGSSSHQSSSAVSFNKSQYSINDPESLWVVVNKGRMLPNSFTPDNLVVPKIPLRLSSGSSEMFLRADTALAMQKMFAAASKQGVKLRLASGYRSYALQIAVYANIVGSEGQAAADAVSAKPGHSEHQTGLAADLEPYSRTCEIDVCFADTPEGQWLAANSYKFGFIIRYPKNSQAITGYNYEPWHVRYVGVGLATQIHKSGQSLEQFFHLPVYTSYPSSSYQLQIGS